MATNTTNYGLRKPAATDVINVDSDLNNTYDFLDTKLKEVSDLQVATSAALAGRSRLEISATNLLLPSGVMTDFLTLNGGAVLPVGVLQAEVWFAVRYAADPPSGDLVLQVTSSVARDIIVQYAPTVAAESGSSDDFTSTLSFTKNLKIPTNATGGVLYRVRVASPSVNPSGTLKFSLRADGTVDTSLLNYSCEWTVRDL